MERITCRREEKVRHEEWVELRFDAADVLAHPEVFTDHMDDFDASSGFLESYPTLIFENGEIYVDEMWGVRDGRVFTSSFSGGVSDWHDSEGQYVKSVNGIGRKLGQFVAAEFRETDWLKENLSKALGEQSE